MTEVNFEDKIWKPKLKRPPLLTKTFLYLRARGEIDRDRRIIRELFMYACVDCYTQEFTLGGFHLGSPQKFRIFSPPPPPLVCKFTQPPLLRLLTMSAFEGPPDVLNGSPLTLHLSENE